MESAKPKLDQRMLKLIAVAVFCGLLLLLALVGFDSTGKFGKRSTVSPEGMFFVRKRCASCHSISSFGINYARVGPDLSDAVVDVPRRFGRSLEEFLQHPTGTMNIVLSSKIFLTDEEKREAVAKLKLAYQRKLEQQNRPAQAEPSIQIHK